MDRKWTPASPATARASRVLPVPGGPTSSTPLGMRAPRARKRLGSFRNSTISCSSAFSSTAPATSLKVTLRCSSAPVRVRALPKRAVLSPPAPPPPAPLWRRNMKYHSSPKMARMTTQGTKVATHAGIRVPGG